jgi:mRNA-degrading endonuclease RelE of RelBE toxin-antitoxin system
MPARYDVRFTADARGEITRLEGSIRNRLRKVLEKKLAVAPTQYGEPLVGVLTGYWSHHFASHRIIYRVYDDPKLVLVCARRAGHRSDIYRHFEALVRAGRTAEQIFNVLRGQPPKKSA